MGVLLCKNSAVISVQLQFVQAFVNVRSCQHRKPSNTHDDTVGHCKDSAGGWKGPWPLQSTKDCANPFRLDWRSEATQARDRWRQKMGLNLSGEMTTGLEAGLKTTEEGTDTGLGSRTGVQTAGRPQNPGLLRPAMLGSGLLVNLFGLRDCSCTLAPVPRPGRWAEGYHAWGHGWQLQDQGPLSHILRGQMQLLIHNIVSVAVCPLTLGNIF